MTEVVMVDQIFVSLYLSVYFLLKDLEPLKTVDQKVWSSRRVFQFFENYIATPICLTLRLKHIIACIMCKCNLLPKVL